MNGKVELEINKRNCAHAKYITYLHTNIHAHAHAYMYEYIVYTYVCTELSLKEQLFDLCAEFGEFLSGKNELQCFCRKFY